MFMKKFASFIFKKFIFVFFQVFSHPLLFRNIIAEIFLNCKKILIGGVYFVNNLAKRYISVIK